MSCNCSTPVTVAQPTSLPTTEGLTEACSNTASCSETVPEPTSSVVGSAVCNPGSLKSSGSSGTTLEAKWTDAIPDHNQEGVTLLARIGSKLASLKGSGFLQLKDGKAVTVSSVAITLKTLWHSWTKGEGINQRTALGDPLPYPYQVIADADGNPHLIQGHATEDGTSVWDAAASAWVVKPLSEITASKKGLLSGAETLELVGYEPIPVTGDASDVRQMKALKGSGVIVVEQTPTVPSDCDCDGCTPTEAVASVARFLPFPTGESTWTLKWTSADGPIWVEDV